MNIVVFNKDKTVVEHFFHNPSFELYYDNDLVLRVNDCVYHLSPETYRQIEASSNGTLESFTISRANEDNDKPLYKLDEKQYGMSIIIDTKDILPPSERG